MQNVLRETLRRWKHGGPVSPVELVAEWDGADPALVRKVRYYLRCLGTAHGDRVFEMEVKDRREGCWRASKAMWWCPECAKMRGGRGGSERDP